MKNAIIVHGTCDRDEYFDTKYPSLSNSHWLPWLQKQLLINNIHTQTPEMPIAYDPKYNLWKTEFEGFEINKETVLIGHSCGGGFLVRWLSENEEYVQKLILIAPWLDPEKTKTIDFFDFKLDPTLIKRVSEIHLFVSTDDDEDVIKSAKMIQYSINNIVVHEFSDKGHFTYNELGTVEFPELLNVII